jgi:hypothetical protein
MHCNTNALQPHDKAIGVSTQVGRCQSEVQDTTSAVVSVSEQHNIRPGYVWTNTFDVGSRAARPRAAPASKADALRVCVLHNSVILLAVPAFGAAHLQLAQTLSFLSALYSSASHCCTGPGCRHNMTVLQAWHHLQLHLAVARQVSQLRHAEVPQRRDCAQLIHDAAHTRLFHDARCLQYCCLGYHKHAAMWRVRAHRYMRRRRWRPAPCRLAPALQLGP